jgi:hypothetical protein
MLIVPLAPLPLSAVSVPVCVCAVMLEGAAKAEPENPAAAAMNPPAAHA